MTKNFLKNTDGNMSAMFAGSLSVLLLSVAVATDVTASYNMKNKMQNALDAAVLNAALNAGEENAASYAEALYLENLSGDAREGAVINFSFEDGNIIASAKTERALFFPGILPESAQNISVQSRAEVVTQSVANPNPTPQPKPCVMALSETASPGITLNSGATIEGAGCEMHVHSVNQNNALTANAGIEITLDRTCVAGNKIVDNSQGAVGNLEKNCAVAADPYAGAVVEPSIQDLSCDYNHGNFGGSDITMQPGVYCGWFNFNNSNAKVHFEPGLYILRNGGWNVNGGSWTGDGVTFYYHDTSKIQFNSGVEATMTAPTTGDYAGFFMTEKPGLRWGSFILNDNKGFNFEGVMYLPSRNITFNGQSGLTSRKLELIGDRITFNNAKLSISSEFTSPLAPPVEPAEDDNDDTTETIFTVRLAD